MADRLTPEARRRNMQAIRSSDTGIEMLVRRALWKKGLRGYRVGPRRIPGRPDVAYLGKKTAVFLDGCFWHGCPRCYRAPETNSAFWRDKVEKNQLRDVRNSATLEEDGWKVLRFWGHEVREDISRCVELISTALQREPSK